MTPETVVQIRRDICRRSKCPHFGSLNFNDACAACPEGHWGRYEMAGCEDKNRVVPDAEIVTSTPQINGSLRPGSLLSSLIFKITGQSTKSCGICGARMAMMNKNGWWWCWKNRKMIIGWLIEEAKKRGRDINEASALSLLKAALKETRLLTPTKSAITNPQQRR